jgi:hypothetical protein
VAGFCEYGDEPSGSGATEFVIRVLGQCNPEDGSSREL